ncbi:MAG: lipoate--protein ligase family protein [Deltaproteobacteria bacterium]
MNKHATTWRLINTGPQSGPLNMAIDEALLRGFDPAASLPVLRLYGWMPAALSLGRFQKEETLDIERCRMENVPVVRRITGGGAIYHAEELTYSIVCSTDQIPPASSVKDSFRVLTGFLLSFYRKLGLDACYAMDAADLEKRLGKRTAYCFAGRESFDILIDGCKIGGNAQRREKGVIFQHGSIPLVNRAAIGLTYLIGSLPEHAHGVTSLVDCGVTSGDEELQHILAAAFKDHFNVECRAEVLSAQEQFLAENLVANKYTKDSWNMEGEGS